MKKISIRGVLFDGTKFAARYGLNAARGDFWISGDTLYVPDSVPNLPVFDPPDAPVDASNKAALALASSGGPEAKAIFAVVATLIDEFNARSQAMNVVLAALREAKVIDSSIADLPERTLEEIKIAVVTKLSEAVE